MNTKWFMAGLAAMVLAMLAWALRWETLYAGRESAYLMNRWTGEIRWLVGGDWHPVGRSKP